LAPNKKRLAAKTCDEPFNVQSRGDWRSFEPLIAAIVNAALSRNDEAGEVIRLLKLSA
jgi:hypothetical protein